VGISIFVSVGRPHSAAQEDFVLRIESRLRQKGLRPCTVGRNEFSHKQPLRAVDELMNRCGGALVIATERLSIERAVERRGAEAIAIADMALTTPWNQIEAGIAYAKRIPLLVIKERRVKEEGLLESRYDWYVHSTELDPSFLDSAEFNGTFESWRRDVIRRAGWFRFRS